MTVSFTDRELDVMAVLWQRGPSTVAEVRDALEAGEVLQVAAAADVVLATGLHGAEALLRWRRADDGREACTVWAPFGEDSEYFKPSDKPYMLNLRVDDLQATLQGLREEGCTVLDRYEESEQGKFGYALDPEGGLLELWEPAAGY